ncbi:MAG: Bax inhibitor-1/YccA family protein [bacterium]|nr:Bax inhibitor-1/YccA family protein [bacterium]
MFNNQNPAMPVYNTGALSVEKSNSILRLVYLWMGLGLLTTCVVAVLVANTPSLLNLALTPGVSIITMVLLIGISIALGVGVTRNWLKPGMAIGLFFVYSAIMGFALSFVVILAEIDPRAVYSAAGTTAALFGAMTFVGFTTKMDLSRFGFFFMAALIGLVLAMLINMLLQSSALDFIISVAGVLLFTALTAYDTQKIKNMAANPDIQADGSLAVKVSIIGALELYLDVINLFLFLLRIFMSRD